MQQLQSHNGHKIFKIEIHKASAERIESGAREEQVKMKKSKKVEIIIF